jgi:putative inorganic carbon (hco3(-)) transporter
MSAVGIQPGLIQPEQVLAPRQNWPLYLFVVMIPLQNLYLQYLPTLAGGLNFINVMFLLSLLVALQCRGGLVRGTGVNGWVMLYLAVLVLALFIGFGSIADPSGHANFFKDQAIAVCFVFLVQMSCSDWSGLRRLFLASLLPLPYMFHVVRDQSASVSAWHYSDDMRINGTFMELGANEMAAFFVTAVLVALGLLVGTKLNWRWRALVAAAVVLSTVAVVLSYSRTAYIAIIAGLLVVMLLPRWRFKLLLPAMLMAVVLPLVLPPAAVERFDSISIEEGERDESTDNRFEFWELALAEFGKRPLLGTGFHTFHHAEFNPHEMDVHNFFLRELVEKGLLGGLILLGLLWSIARLLWRGLRHAEAGSWYSGLVIGLSGAFVALLIGNVFGDRFTHYPMIAHFWLYIGLALRGLQLRAAELAEAASRAP